jgi:hypothetical protein
LCDGGHFSAAPRPLLSGVFDTGDKTMAKIIKTRPVGFSQFLGVLVRRHSYRWYEVEVACF